MLLLKLAVNTNQSIFIIYSMPFSYMVRLCWKGDNSSYFVFSEREILLCIRGMVSIYILYSSAESTLVWICDLLVEQIKAVEKFCLFILNNFSHHFFKNSCHMTQSIMWFIVITVLLSSDMFIIVYKLVTFHLIQSIVWFFVITVLLSSDIFIIIRKFFFVNETNCPFRLYGSNFHCHCRSEFNKRI